MRVMTLRVALVLAAERDLCVEAVDIPSAYLNSDDLEEEVWMEVPPGIDAPRGTALKLRKPLYSLNQAGRAWSHRLRAFLESIGFRCLDADHGTYTRTETGRQSTWLLSWVNNLILFARDRKIIDGIKKALRKEFGLTKLGEPTSLVGIRITRDKKRGEIHLDQGAYIRVLSERYSVEHAKPVRTPGGIAEKARTDDQSRGEALEDLTKYRALVGALLFVVMPMRPDIAFVVGHLGRRQSAPRQLDWTAALRVLKYLHITANWKLRFARQGSEHIVGYVDADYTECQETRRSTSGHVFLLGGGAVSWRSRHQEVVATSTTEAEYIALSEASKEAVWLWHLSSELGLKCLPIDIYEDNWGAFLLAQHPNNHSRSKHIDVRWHYVRECVECQEITLRAIPTEDMTADILTKALTRVKHDKHAKGLGMLPG